MPDSSRKNRHLISLFLIIAIIVTIIIQLLSCTTCSITFSTSFLIEFTLLFVTIFTFITAFKHYHIFVHLGLAFGIYSLIVNLSSQLIGGTFFVTTFITPIFIIISLFFIITGVRISIKEYEKKVVSYRLQKIELNKRLNELSEMSMALDQANKKNRLLISLTRHDLLNQLTVILGLNAVMIEELETSETSEIKSYLSMIEKAGERIKEMIYFTKEYEELGVETSGWQQLQQLIDSSLPEVSLDGITIENLIHPNLKIYADPIIRKVFSTFLENSIRHGGKSLNLVRFSSTITNKNLIIRYEDNGIGVHPEDKEKIFTLGYGNHTGIGLYLSREILSINGFEIHETGEFEKGVRFEIIVPEEKFQFAD